jgi:hypothetical protein
MFRLITLLFLTTSAWATDPVFTIGSDPVIDITGTGQGLSLGDDSMSGMKNIGFDFTFYDQTFSQVNISMNGFFTFQSNFSVPRVRNYRSETLPATSFNYSVFPAWSDFIRRSSGNQSPYIQTFGQTADTDQYFVIMWDNVSEYSNGLKSTFQAILYETTNEIAFRYDELRIQNHDLTIGIQGNNEALTYMRYEDTNSTTFIETDDFSVSTAIDESFSNLSSECLIDSSFSTLCDVYDLGNNFEDDDYLYGISEDIIYGYDEDTTFYGFDMDEDEQPFAISVVFADDGDWSDDGHYDDTFLIFNDIEPSQEFELEDDTLFIHLDGEYDIEYFDPLPDLEEIDFLEIVEIEEEEFIQHFEEVHERMEEDFLVFMEEEISEEEFVEVVEEFFDEEEAIEEEEEALDEAIEEITPEEVEEEQEEKGATRRNIITTRNLVSDLVTSVVRGSYTSANSTSNDSNNSGSVSVSGTTVGNVNSPTVSNQVAADQVQTNTVLQSITVMPMPGVDNTPSVAMAEVQVTTMENQIESVTSSVMTASEADQVADQIVAQNIQSQQEENERSQSESGEYSTQGQANLLAYMGYSAGFNAYQNMNIPDGSNWYEPRTIYANVILDDNITGYYSLVGTNLDQQANLIQTQNMEFFR